MARAVHAAGALFMCRFDPCTNAAEHHREGIVTPPGASVSFRLVGSSGRFDRAGAIVLFDLDADGNFDDAALSDERFAADDSTAYVSIGHGHWSFEAAPDGASLVLRRRDDVDAPRPSIAPGASAPDFTYVGDGDERTLKSLRGSPVVLEFFASGCGFSHEAGPQIADAAGALRGAGARLISVSTDGDASEARSFADEHRKNWPVLVGAEAERVSRLYRVTSTPTLILIDEQGTIETRGNWRDLRTRIESGL